jgi:hypothetical protein
MPRFQEPDGMGEILESWKPGSQLIPYMESQYFSFAASHWPPKASTGCTL